MSHTISALNDLLLKEAYDSDEDNILEDFYIPALSRATRYDRLAGFFSSSILGTAAQGMARFIQNGGKMRLVTCIKLSEPDLQAINDGLTKPEEVLTRTILSELDVKDQLEQDHVAALAGMVARGDLEIKLAIPYNKSGGFGKIDGDSLYHQKIGVLHNSEDSVSFSGSINETRAAWTGNIEEFKVFCSWKAGQDSYCRNDAKKFEKFWNNRSQNTRVFDLPDAAKRHLIAIASKSSKKDTEPQLRSYQMDAVTAWFEHDRRGILEMATGTGKTMVAIECIRRVIDEPQSRNLIVITCPFTHLVTQWVEEIKKWNIRSIPTHGLPSSLRTKLGNDIHYLNSGIRKHLIIVTTNSTFSNKKFTKIIKSSKVNQMLVADEVHKLGAEKTSEGMLDSYNYRLGLSATPERYFDDAGSKSIFEFFGGVVFRFDIDKAISNGYLTHYKLFPHLIYMNTDETDRYHTYSRMLAIEQAKKDPDMERIKNLSIRRSRIVKSAAGKLDEFKKIIRESDLDHCLVYCADHNQLEDANKILHNAGMMFHRFTAHENAQEREALLDEFAKGEKSILLAIRCLDEGVDVPSTKTAIILASSHNPIEFVQRRGRILRQAEGKTHALIHDMMVLPRSLPDDEIRADSKKMIRKEFKRLEEFAQSSDNPEFSRDLIRDVFKQYGIDVQ